MLNRIESLANHSGFYPVGEIAHISTIAEFGGENQVPGPREIDVDRPGWVMIGHGRRLPSFLAVDEHAKDHAAQGPGPLVDSHERLKATIAWFDLVRQKGRALRAKPTVVDLTAQVKGMAVDRSIDAKWTSRSDIRKILIADKFALGKIHH